MIGYYYNISYLQNKWFLQYSFLHVTPPMSAPNVLKACKDITNAAGFLEVNKETMQSTKFSNIFGIGDCTDSPNSKTAAAVGRKITKPYENQQYVINKYFS